MQGDRRREERIDEKEKQRYLKPTVPKCSYTSYFAFILLEGYS